MCLNFDYKKLCNCGGVPQESKYVQVVYKGWTVVQLGIEACQGTAGAQVNYFRVKHDGAIESITNTLHIDESTKL